MTLPSPSRPASPTGRGAWHRKASRPILWWMAALIVLVVVHRWIPQSRWLLVHMVTLGLVTTSIMIWGQHFAESLLKVRLDEADRRVQVRRIYALTLGIAVTCTGMVAAQPIVTSAGALVVAGAMTWYALSLLGQLRRALPARFTATVRFYVGAALLLPVGALLGSFLAFGLGEPWQGRVLLAHQITNVLGFVGITATGTLVTLWPTILRTRMQEGQDRAGNRALIVMLAALAVMIGGALGGVGLAVAAGAVLYLAGLGIIGRHLVACVRASAPTTFAALSVAAGVLWLIGSVIALAVIAGRTGPPGGHELLAGDVQQLTVPFVAGFLLQLLLGAMSHLMPTVMGGGPRAVRAALAEMDRFGAGRVAIVNAGLIVFLLSQDSWTRVLVSLVVFGAFAAVLPLMIRMVIVSVRERKRTAAEAAEPPSDDAPAGASAARAQARPAAPGTDRRHFAEAVVGLGGVLGAVALGSAIGGGSGRGDDAGSSGGSVDVAPTGHTTKVAVVAAGMRFTPAVIDVPAGDTLEITVRNEDREQVHDLVLATGETTGRLAPGARGTITTGVVTGDIDGWCSIAGHRAMGMVLTVSAVGAAGSATSDGGGHEGHDMASMGSGAAGERRTVDLTVPPGDGFVTRDAALPPLPAPGRQEIELVVTEDVQELAPGVPQTVMTFGGRPMGPVLRASIGDTMAVHLVNNGSMGHSVDFHAGTVSPDANMRTIPPGEALDYVFQLHRSGIWLYHCSTMPMSMHIAAGMFGAVIVTPATAAAVDKEWVLVQSEAYLGPDGGEVDAGKIAEEKPDLTMFNGHANQYVHAPLQAKVGERVRIWVLAAGPSRGISFHVVGAQFDTVFKEGAFLLRPEQETGGGAQALDLASAQGGFVEMVFEEPGHYTFVNHSFVEMERGARGIIEVTA